MINSIQARIYNEKATDDEQKILDLINSDCDMSEVRVSMAGRNYVAVDCYIEADCIEINFTEIIVG